jgi:hypothetical protein
VAEPLGPAWEKLRRAWNHFENLRPQIEAVERESGHTFSYELDGDAGEYVFYIHDLAPPDSDWGLVLGDCIHNARSALDCLAVQLFALATGQHAKDVEGIEFPVASDVSGLKRAVKQAAKVPSFSGYLKRIEELQPYNDSNPSVWERPAEGDVSPLSTLPGVLKQLHDLDNIDKHRVVHTPWAGVDSARGLFPVPEPWPSDFFRLAGVITGDALVNDAEVGRLSFLAPLPQRWNPTQADIKRCFPLEVVLDVNFVSKGVLVVLPLFIKGVREVLRLFEPAVRHGSLVLPLTALQWPPKRWGELPDFPI